MVLTNASVEDYKRVLYALMPPGPAFESSDLLLDGLAAEFARCHNRIVDIVKESDPRTTTELLDAWETDAGLPDPCDGIFEVETPLSERQRILCAKLLSTGGQNAAYYKQVAKELGYDIEVHGYCQHTVESCVSEPINGPDWVFAFAIVAQEETIRDASVEDDVDTPLRWWGNRRLECKINSIKQSHTIPVFIYK